MLEYICDNIGPVFVCLPRDVTTAPSRYMNQPSRIPILSPVLFMHVGDPLFDLLVFFSFIQTGSNLSVYATSSFLHCITMRYVTKKIGPCTCFSNVMTLYNYMLASLELEVTITKVSFLYS